MMLRLPIMVCAVLLIGAVSVSATPPIRHSRPAELLVHVAASCFGGKIIPTDAHPILDAKRIARMRAAGQLPDTFVCGRCRYNLGGDPGAVYYVKVCR